MVRSDGDNAGRLIARVGTNRASIRCHAIDGQFEISEQKYGQRRWTCRRDGGRGARGFLDRPVLGVLIISTSLIVGLFALVYFFVA